MLRKWGMLVLMLLAVPALALAQNTGKVSGVVTDADTGDPLPGASVALIGTQLGSISDIDGNYFIIGVPVGSYDVQASFVGFQTATVSNVEITAGYTREINFALSAGIELNEIIVEYERPLIQKDAIGVPKVVSAEEIQNLPVRGAANLAALQGSVISDETSGTLNIRGGRGEEVSYYVDGVRVIGAVAVPTQAVQEQEMLIGSIPARYGDAMSGIISITTKGGKADRMFGSIEAISSEVLDPFGYNTLSATLGGPLVSENASFFLSTEYSTRGDAGPRALGFPQLSEAAYANLQANPQSVQVDGPDGEVVWMHVPAADLAALAAADGTIDGDAAADAMNAAAVAQYGEGWHTHDGHPNPGYAPLTFTAADWNREDAAPQRQSESLTLNGNVSLNLTSQLRLRVGGGYETSSGDQFSNLRSLYSRGDTPFGEFDRNTYRVSGTLTHYISNSTFYQLQADFSDYKGNNWATGFSKNVEDVLFYGDIDHPANAVAARYYEYDSANNVYTQRFGDGNFPNARDIQSTWAPPGNGGAGYSKWHNQRLGLRASATTQFGIHQIDFGVEYETRTDRFFTGGSYSLARFYDDGNAEGSPAVASYGDLEFGTMDTRVYYYGYNYLGTKEVDSQSVTAFANKEGANAFDIEPYKPSYLAGYFQDKIEFRDIVLQIGLRLDAFNNNSLILKDPYSLFEVTRAGDAGLATGVIGSDFTVFYNESTGGVTGFRDTSGNFYDAAGNEVAAGAVTFGSAPNVLTNKLTENVFTTSEAQVNFQPRIGVSFPVTDRALFYAAYDVVTQRPSENVYDTIQQFQQATERSKRNNNPNLKPERTTQYELGFRQRIGARAAFQLSGFYRQIENKIALRIFQNVTPSNYQSYENVDFGTVKGIELEFDLRRTNGIALNANYTYSIAKGTGADAASTRQIVWRQETAPFYPNFINFLDFDQRHTVNITADYRLGEGEGPQIGGAYPLANFGMNLTATTGSGKPYTRRDDASPLYTSFNGFLEGELNSQRLPSSSMLNLRVDRRFSLGARTNLVAYVWVQNLLDSDNVLAVYPQTGLAGDDGFLSGAEGRDAVNAIRSSSGDVFAQSFIDHYQIAANNPFRYGIPRQTRIGLRLDF